MKAEELLEVIGNVDETILANAEPRRRSASWKYILAAAIVIALATTAVSVGYSLQSKPIGNVETQTDPTAFPFTMDADGNIVHDPQGAVLVMMETEYDAQAPDYLEELYEIHLPDGWRNSPHGGGSGNRWTMDITENAWELEGEPGWILLGQTTARRHESFGKNCVDVLYGLNAAQPIITEKVQLAGLEMLKVTIPSHNAAQNNYCKDGHTRLYWCDGQYILYFTYPHWMEDAEAEQILTTLTRRKALWSYPENYGNIDPARISNVSGSFHMEGLTVPQYTYLYTDGCIWFGEPNYLMQYHAATGTLDRIYLNTGDLTSANPRYLYDAGDYIGFYSDDTQYRIRKDGQGIPEAIGEGYYFNFFYDMWSYAVEDHAIVRTHIMTGEKQTLAEGIESISAQDGKICAIPEGVEDAYWVYDMECTSYEIVPRDPQWGKVTPVGDVTVLTAEYGRLFLERDGKITSLGIKAWDQIAWDGRLYYRPEGGDCRELCVYDPKNDTHETVMEGVFAFAILQDRYLACTKTGEDGKTRGYTHIFTDLQTGKSVTFDLHESLFDME